MLAATRWWGQDVSGGRKAELRESFIKYEAVLATCWKVYPGNAVIDNALLEHSQFPAESLIACTLNTGTLYAAWLPGRSLLRQPCIGSSILPPHADIYSILPFLYYHLSSSLTFFYSLELHISWFAYAILLSKIDRSMHRYTLHNPLSRRLAPAIWQTCQLSKQYTCLSTIFAITFKAVMNRNAMLCQKLHRAVCRICCFVKANLWRARSSLLCSRVRIQSTIGAG